MEERTPSWEEEQRLVREAEESFPAEFGLYAFPGDKFRIRKRAGFYDSREGVQVVVEVKVKPGSTNEKMFPGREWLDFIRTSPGEVRKEMRGL